MEKNAALKYIYVLFTGYARFESDILFVGNTKTIEFGFRTQMHTGIIFFAHGGTGIYIYCALINGALHFEFANGLLVGSVTFNRPDVNFCDSKWYTVTLQKTGQQAMITVKDYGTEVSGDSLTDLTVLTSSEVLLGGLPVGSEAEEFVVRNKLSMPIAGQFQGD